MRKSREAGFKYIVGSNVAKTPYEIYEIEEYLKGEKEQLIDGQIFETRKEFNNKTTRQTKERQVVYQCKQKRE